MSRSNEIEMLLSQGRELSTTDFLAACGDMPAASVYSRIRALHKAGRLSRCGRGKYLPVHKPKYRIEISPWMREVNEIFFNDCPGIDHCLYEKDSNLYVESYKSDLPTLTNCLMAHGYKVIDNKTASRFPYALEGYVIVAPMVSEAPISCDSGLIVPTIEKDLVDLIHQNNVPPDDLQRRFQQKMEVYPVNLNKLKRYAARRGVADELSYYLSGLDSSRIELFSKVQTCLSEIPVTQAWVFGSFARGEETQESDLDLLVDYDASARVSLLDTIRYKLDIEKAIHREVDLVTNGCLKPFALPSAERDKYLIYAR